MSDIEITLHNDVGLHARPAALLVRTAARFTATTTVYHGARRADARSVLSLLQLGARSGATLRVVAEGPDAEAALQAIRALVDGNFAE